MCTNPVAVASLLAFARLFPRRERWISKLSLPPARSGISHPRLRLLSFLRIT